MNFRRGCVIAALTWAAALFIPQAAASAHPATGVGFAPITIHDPVNGGTMPGYVFYPATHSKGVTRIGPYTVHATRDATPIAGTKPLVVISHGHGGDDLEFRSMAVYLASHGFVAATLQHPKDNYLDRSGNGHAAVLGGRPIQVSATISMLLDDPHWKTLIDPDRIGAAGFSAGGYTVLLLVGAVPRFDRLIGYCAHHPKDKDDICGFIKKLPAQGQTVKDYLDAVQKDYTRWGEPDDPRVKAAFAMAPFSLVFDKAGLASIDRPVFLYDGQDDRVLLTKYNVLHVAPLIKTLVGIKMIPGAGHYVFMGPCPPRLAEHLPDLCKAPPGVDRAAVQKQVNADALAFFRKTLDVPAHLARPHAIPAMRADTAPTPSRN
jgi:predicted dienelactone hydrolase